MVHLRITARGKQLLKRLQPSLLLKNIPDNSVNMKSLARELQQLLRSIQQENDLKTFGVCHSCRYNQKLDNGTFLCGLTQETLSRKEIQLICREHTVITA